MTHLIGRFRVAVVNSVTGFVLFIAKLVIVGAAGIHPPHPPPHPPAMFKPLAGLCSHNSVENHHIRLKFQLCLKANYSKVFLNYWTSIKCFLHYVWAVKMQF